MKEWNFGLRGGQNQGLAHILLCYTYQSTSVNIMVSAYLFQYMEQPDIEKEVKRLFRTDADAISVKWELVTDDEKPAVESGEVKPGLGAGTSGLSRTDTTASLDIGRYPGTD